MLDLCSGLAGASDPFKERGWEVITVDINPNFNPTVCTDIINWNYQGRKPNLIWASPDCTQFCKKSLPLSWACNRQNPPKPDTSLMLACKRIIDKANPDYWVIENVRGAVFYFTPYLGKVKKKIGSRYLWGEFPPFDTSPKYGKWKLSPSKDRAARRSIIPKGLSLSLLRSIEIYGGL